MSAPSLLRWRQRRRGSLPLAVLIAVTTLVGFLTPGQLRLSWMLTGLGLYLLLLVWQATRTPAAPPIWARGWPIIVCFAAFAITRHGAGAVASGFTPLAVLPVVGAGLYGHRRDVIIALAVGTAAFALPPLLDPATYPPGVEIRRALLWLVADALIAITIHRLVASHHRHIENLTLLASMSRDLSTAANAREAICRVTAQICSADLVYLLEREDSTHAAAHWRSSNDPGAHRAPITSQSGSAFAIDNRVDHRSRATPPNGVNGVNGVNASGQQQGSSWVISTAAVGQVRGQHAPPVRINTATPSLTADAFAGRRAGFVADVAAEPGVSEAIRVGLDVASATWQPVGTTTLDGGTDSGTDSGADSGSGRVGLLIVVWHRHRDELDPAMAAMLAALAADAAVAIERENLLARVQQAASHDALTGLVNRHHWDTAAAHEVARASRDRQPLTFALIDLDHFKRYNDTRGHLAGDDLLRGFAQQARTRLRDVDTFARWGGEEFAIAMPGCTAGDALLVAERLHTAVPEGQTCTIGISQWRPGQTHHDTLRHADEALYEGKNRQRGTTTIQ